MHGILTSQVLGLIGDIGWSELLIIGIIGVIVFGKRLPEVGKNVGKSIVEFKKGLSGMEDQIDDAASPSRDASSAAKQPEEEHEQEAGQSPKWIAPTSEGDSLGTQQKSVPSSSSAEKHD